ncbi:unannotated protein [freshwater metagenome]|uniref:Unannotated protein n=1 Tax=freshwater metagenome TaxID=449393 RepID=A0A6J7PNC1_9ZZZZ
MKAVSSGSMNINDVVEAMRVEEQRALALITSLVNEGLLQRFGSMITLP